MITDKIRITEGVTSNYFYHLAKMTNYESLCGCRVMNMYISLKDWGCECGNKDIHFKWCSECYEIAKREGLL